MALTATTSDEMLIGAGDLFYKDAAGIWQPAGATRDDNVFRVHQTMFQPDINGVTGPIKATDYKQEEWGELECTLLQIGGNLPLDLQLPGVGVTTEATTAAGTPATGTLADNTVAGQTLAIKVSAVTNLSVGDFLKFGTTGVQETRQVTRVGTNLIGGTGIDINYPLTAPHTLGDAFTELVGAGATIYTPASTRRVPSASYHDWRLDVPGLNGRVVRFFVYDGVSTEDAEYTAQDDEAMGPRVVVRGRIDPANQPRGSWSIRREIAYT